MTNACPEARMSYLLILSGSYTGGAQEEQQTWIVSNSQALMGLVGTPQGNSCRPSIATTAACFKAIEEHTSR
jgi:hypothetical protein